jgi:transposase
MAFKRPSRRSERALLYLPPYSQDFNPIEMAFSKLKALLRAAAARTMPDLWQAIANTLKRFSPRGMSKLSRRG